MEQVRSRSELVVDIHSASDEAVLCAARGLFALGEYGEPAGDYLLRGGKAALRLWRLADAAILLYHGMRVAEPNTLLWAEIMVNRAVACAQHGFYNTAITVGEEFIEATKTLPAARRWLPYAHHAIGFAYDHLSQYGAAATHFRLAVDGYTNPVEKGRSCCDLASALAMGGNSSEAAMVLEQVNVAELDEFSTFAFHFATLIVRYYQGDYSEAVAAGDRADDLAEGKEEAWATPLAELRLWLSRASWACGDRFKAKLTALQAAVMASRKMNMPLSDAATQWLSTISGEGI